MTQTMSAGGRLLAQRLAAVLGDPPAAGGDGLVAPAGRAGSATPAAAKAGAGEPPLPDYVAHVLARWDLLHDVPFRYLVPDARLLPPESIRFFRLDRGWLDRLRAGALAVGGGDGSRERAATAALLPRADGAAAEHLPLVREVQRGRISIPVAAEVVAEERAESVALAAGTDAVRLAGAAVPVTGFLLRSALVSGWPAMQIRAWASDLPADVPPGVDPDELAGRRPDLVVPLLRLQRLSPAVLLALFHGAPRLIWLQEPPQSVQFGLEPSGTGWRVPVRSAGGQEVTSVPVPMRPGPVAGVVDVATLAGALDAAVSGSPPNRGAGVALSLLQAPSRQRFAA
ncbi:hypothetical protein, partial [Micromonospora olivasterospora]